MRDGETEAQAAHGLIRVRKHVSGKSETANVVSHPGLPDFASNM